MGFFSLEKKLPFLIGGLVAIALIATVLVVRVELRHNAVGGAGERLTSITGRLDQLIEGTIDARSTVVDRIGREPVLADYVAGRHDDVAAVRATLERLRTASDSTLPIQLRSLDGVVLAATGSERAVDGASAPLPSVAVPLANDRVVWSDIHVAAGRAGYWIAAPVFDGRRVVAHIVQQRRFGTGGAGGQIEELVGGQAEIYFTNVAGGPWAALDGGYLADAPIVADTTRFFQYRDAAGDLFFARAQPLAGTSWLLVTRMSSAAVLGRADQAIRRIALIGAVLLLLGLVGAWLISRSVTKPLRRLRHAADAIATGDYSRRTGLDQDDEIGRVARSFDTMARHVQLTHDEIARRYGVAQTLAAELEQTNARLQHAILDADMARLEAQEASRVKSEFLATMSHEIRTPINAVVGYADLMDLGLPGPMTQQQRDYVGRIRRSSEHLISLVNDVLDFAKIESGQMRIKREPASVALDIDAAITMLQPTIASKRIEITVDNGHNARYIGDAQRVQQILLNLLSNALKFTAPGGRIEVRSDRRRSRALLSEEAGMSSWVCVAVEDTGPGIPAELHEPIFQPFVQGAGGYTRPHGGTGLGLAISRSLARTMSGDLTLESVPGAGSTFTLWLPAAETAAAPTEPPRG